MKSFAVLLLFVSTFASGLEVESRILNWHPPKSGEAPTNSDLWSKGSIKMPYVTGGPVEIAARINDALYMAQLQMPAPEKPGKSFSMPEGASPEGTTQLDFDVSRNDASILEITFNGEGCGAYCEDFTTAVDFDARSGRTISLDDLLTPDGKAMAADLMQKERRKLYSAQIRELKKQKAQELAEAKKSGKKPVLDDTDERVAFNEDCLGATHAGREPAMSVDYMRFSLPTDNGITLSAGRCSAHVNRALDDVGDVSLTLTPKILQPMLTPYGKALLLDRRAASAPASVFGQVLHGKLGGAAVTVMFHERFSDGSFSADYFYNKYRKLIHLDGMQAGKQITLTEQINDKEQAAFKLNLGDADVSGTWRGAGKELPVVLAY